MSQLVLASASPQRKRLLEGLGVGFRVEPSSYDEAACTEVDPVQRASFLAKAKAEVVGNSHPGDIVIGCDTLVVSAEGELLEKPEDADAARIMIGKLSGKTCQVHSALCVLDSQGNAYQDTSTSRVTFKELSEADLDWWISTGLWEDRSGSFQIDGPGQLMISHIEGDWSSVVGLPVYLLGQLLTQAGFDLTT